MKTFNQNWCLLAQAILLMIGLVGSSPPKIPDTGNVKIPRRAKSPSVHTAPLDPNESVHHTLDEVTSILGTLGGAGSGTVMGLTGVSVTDCASSVKEEELSTMTCGQFIGKLSKCDSMAHVKPLLNQAKKKYQKNPHSKEPCFTNTARKG